MSHLGCATRRCTAEQGWSSFVAAHLARVERRADLQLPERFTHAQARRAKVTDISDGETHAVTWDVEPTELLEEAFDAIETATFVGKGDREFVQYRLAEFEWIIRSVMLLATEQAQSEQHANAEPATAWRFTRGLLRLKQVRLSVFSTRRNASGGAASSWQRNRTSPMVSMTPLSVAPLTPLSVAPLIHQGSGSTAVAALSQHALAHHEAQDGVHALSLDVSIGHSPSRRNQRRRSSGAMSAGSHVGRRDSVSSRASRRYEALEDDVEAQQDGL
jgi:hypothetical protein